MDGDPVGTVYLVGAGPGDPGLLTRRGAEVLARADVVVYDHLASPRLLDLAPPAAPRVCAGKSVGHCTLHQDEINRLLVEHARAGRTVVRLKGGDPFVFGRGGEEILALASAGIPFRIIPGVTAGLGALASTWIPATMRGVNQAIILATGHGADDGTVDWTALARTRQPIVIYMGLRNLEAIADALLRGGLPAGTPAAVIASATLVQQQVLVSTLGCIAADARSANLEGPTLVVIGDIVDTRREILDTMASAAQCSAPPPEGVAPAASSACAS